MYENTVKEKFNKINNMKNFHFLKQSIEAFMNRYKDETMGEFFCSVLFIGEQQKPRMKNEKEKLWECQMCKQNDFSFPHKIHLTIIYTFSVCCWY